MSKLFKLIIFIGILLFESGCQNTQSTQNQNTPMNEKNRKVRDYVVENAVIAHRGTTYWAPEETEAAFRWARTIGADYLEMDMQRSKDGVLLALHDDNLSRTTDCKTVFPNDSLFRAGNYSYEDLMRLDAGSWFNKVYPDRNPEIQFSNMPVYKVSGQAFSFSGMKIPSEPDSLQAIKHPNKQIYVGGKQYISTLEDVMMIARGWRIARDAEGNRLYDKQEENGKTNYIFYYVKDTNDNGNRPGLYIETKEPDLHPGIEQDLYTALATSGWNILEDTVSEQEPYYKNNKINTGNTRAKIVLQTFSPTSLKNLNLLFKGEVPVCFLLWLGDPNMLQADTTTYTKNILFALEEQAHFIGPSIGGAPNNYFNLLEQWEADLIHSYGLKIHAYSFDTQQQTEEYAKRTDAIFTNRSALTIQFYKNRGGRKDIPLENALETLQKIGY